MIKTVMPANPATNDTSLRNRPALRSALIGVWTVGIAYTTMTLGVILSPQFKALQGRTFPRALLEIPALIQFVLDYGVDLLLIFGFSALGAALIVRRSDDWFAIFTSFFVIIFGVRVTYLANTIALMPGYERVGGLILAMGDIGIVLFSALFPDGKFVPRWAKFLVPLLAASMLGIYIFPNAPFFWGTMSRNNYLLATTVWYLAGLASLIYRYIRHATLAQRQRGYCFRRAENWNWRERRSTRNPPTNAWCWSIRRRPKRSRHTLAGRALRWNWATLTERTHA